MVDIADGSFDSVPQLVEEVTLSDGSSIALHGNKWDGPDCELLDVILPLPFGVHLLKSPVLFVGTFSDLSVALCAIDERARLMAPKKVSLCATLFPVSGVSEGGDSPVGKYDESATGFDDVQDLDDEELGCLENMSCDDECDGSSSSDDDFEGAHIEGVVFDIEF